jgi:hypothetical protein
MTIAASRLTGYPLTGTIIEGCLAVEACSDFQPDPGALPRHPGYKAGIERFCLRFHQTSNDLDSRLPQQRRAFACNQGIRVFHGHYHSRNAGRD